MKSFSIQEALKFGWNAFKRDPWVYVGAMVVILVVSMLGNNDGRGGGLISLVATIATWWLTLGLMRMTLNSYAGLPIKFEMLFKESWTTLWHYALAMIASGIIIAIGFVLLIVPGFMALTALAFVSLLVLEKGMKPLESLKESRRMTDGKRWDIFFFMLVLILINILGAIPMGLGLLVTAPVSMLAMVYVYKAIDKKDDMAPVAPTQMPPATATPMV